MSTKVRFAGVLAIAITIVGCDTDDRTVNSRPAIDSATVTGLHAMAQEMALYYSGQYEPPLRLTRDIESDLVKLHQSGALLYFQPPWANHSVASLWDSTTEELILAGRDRNFEALLRKYDLSVHVFRSMDFCAFYLIPTRIVHPERLAERIEAEHMSGMSFLWVPEQPKPYFINTARLATNHSTKYFVMATPCPDIWSSYQYYEFDGARLKYHGIFSDCPPDSIEMWKLPWDQQQHILDSIEASRPAWVDTARQELRRLAQAPSYRYSSVTPPHRPSRRWLYPAYDSAN
jgi:hypothetical protein